MRKILLNRQKSPFKFPSSRLKWGLRCGLALFLGCSESSFGMYGDNKNNTQKHEEESKKEEKRAEIRMNNDATHAQENDKNGILIRLKRVRWALESRMEAMNTLPWKKETESRIAEIAEKKQKWEHSEEKAQQELIQEANKILNKRCQFYNDIIKNNDIINENLPPLDKLYEVCNLYTNEKLYVPPHPFLNWEILDIHNVLNTWRDNLEEFCVFTKDFCRKNKSIFCNKLNEIDECLLNCCVGFFKDTENDVQYAHAFLEKNYWKLLRTLQKTYEKKPEEALLVFTEGSTTWQHVNETLWKKLNQAQIDLTPMPSSTVPSQAKLEQEEQTEELLSFSNRLLAVEDWNSDMEKWKHTMMAMLERKKREIAKDQKRSAQYEDMLRAESSYKKGVEYIEQTQLTNKEFYIQGIEERIERKAKLAVEEYKKSIKSSSQAPFLQWEQEDKEELEAELALEISKKSDKQAQNFDETF